MAAGRILLIALLLAACDRTARVGPDVIARIDRDLVRYGEFEAFLRANGVAGGEPRDVEVLARLLDQFLDERLLRHAAVERGLLPPEGDARSAVEALLRAAPPAEPTRAELEAHLAAHRADFERAERVRLLQIVTGTAEEAHAAAAELAAGADFSDVARRRSRGPAAERGGDQGVLERDDLPPAFAEIIFALRPGEPSEILQAEYGWLLFQVSERLPASTPSLAEAETEVRRALRRERADRDLAALVAEARSRYTTEVYVENLPFRYRGPYAPDS